ncbi:MAG: hypothetical protein ACHQEM_07405 [Chitinophagales bacterium]
MDWAKPSSCVLTLGMLVFATGSGRFYEIHPNERSAKSLITLGCSPGSSFKGKQHGKAAPFPILPGWGKYHYSISSPVDSARLYFDQGLSLYYSYHPNEAFSSFEEAAKLDPNSAMAYWGQALSSGPYYNGNGYSMPDEVSYLLLAMNARIHGASEKEKDLLAAMNLRYNPGGDSGHRNKLNYIYADAMRKLVYKYPQDLDIKALYIDGVMLEHPWDFWFNDGNPKAWTEELVSLCEEILKNDPMHPGAMHYYIHLTEASQHPEIALKDANLLKEFMPGVPHMVHMASHVYERTGHFFEGVEVNDIANQNEDRYDSIENGISSGQVNHHYLAVQAFCAINAGMLKEGMPKIFKCRQSVAPSKTNMYSQYLYMFPVLAWVRMGQWQSILNSPAPRSDWTYARILEYFAKGLAWLRLNQLDSAKDCARNLKPLMGNKVLTENLIRSNTALQAGTVAWNILEAELNTAMGRKDSAIFYYEKAIRAEDALIYFEPKDWLLPARQFYGASLLNWGEPVRAEKIFKEDLVWNPGNGWSLFGLYQCAISQHKPQQAATYKEQYKFAFRHSDIQPNASVF